MKKVTRAIILDKKNSVLLGKRARGIGKGQWALVGGKPDEGETPAEAVVREVHEELGLTFTPQFYKEEMDLTDKQNPWRVFYFTGEISGELHPNPEEISEVIYATNTDLDELNIAFDHRDRLREFFGSHR